MLPVKDHFIDLERHRRQLEENVAKLQRALDHWRMSDAEYEQLKDEVEAVPEPPSRDDLDRIRDEFEGEVIADKEIEELFGKSNERSRGQIVNLISRRIDYVSKNVETLEKQLEAAEQKLAAASVLINPDVRDEEGLPFTDIIEELDDDDNVTSFRLSRPGDMQPQIREALAKAGIKDIPDEAAKDGGDGVMEDGEVPAKDAHDGAEDATVEIAEDERAPTLQSEQHQRPEPEPEVKKTPARKGVSFAEDTKTAEDPAFDGDGPISQTAQRLQEVMEQARQQAIPAPEPVIPEDESEDDAEARREMLRYGMTDIAPIVAELEIDENSGSEFEEDYDDYDYEEDEDEDEHGRYRYRVVDDDYRARMLELESKLGIKSTRELLEEQQEGSGGVPDEGIARIAVQPMPMPQPQPQPQPAKSELKTDDNKAAETKPVRKGVKFASAVDVAPEKTTAPASPPPPPEQPFVDPMKSTIVERSPAVQPAAPAPDDPPKKVSRFKKAKTGRGATDAALPIRSVPPTVPLGPANVPARFHNPVSEVRTATPTGPDGTTLAGTVVERDAPVGAKEPDEFDAALLQKEVAVEYNRMRNRIIMKEGGFTRDKDAPIEYPDEEDEGGKPLSRFKAARLARQ